MADHPILFTAPMVRALLAGTKTQTRRIIKPRKHASIFDGSWDDSYVLDPGNSDWRAQELRYAVGDRLYVREHWRTVPGCDDLAPRDLIPHLMPIHYEADGGAMPWQTGIPGRFRQGMHMPRWASRITLTVTDVRVERLQEISEEDVTAEGCRRIKERGMDGWEYHGEHWATSPDGSNACCYKRAADSYRQLWEIINGPGSWDANPFVVAYTFTVALHNIDQETRHVEA